MPKIVDHEARRSAISTAAAGLIAARGMEAATIREIARVSGYSKGVVEHYFVDKEEAVAPPYLRDIYSIPIIELFCAADHMGVYDYVAVDGHYRPVFKEGHSHAVKWGVRIQQDALL